MPFTEKEQKRFEDMVSNRCKTGGSRKAWIKKVADFLFEMTGDVNWRMAVFNTYE